MMNRIGSETFPKLTLILVFLLLIVGCSNGQDDSPADEPVNNTPKTGQSDATEPPAVSQVLDEGAVAAEGAIKVLIDTDGVYRLSIDMMRDAGIALSALDAGNLSLTQAGEQVPYVIDGDQLVFYGRAGDSRYSVERPYILRAGETGLLMQTGVAPAIQSPALTTVPQMIKVEENLYYEQRAAESEGEVWFWQKIVSDGPDAKMTFEIDLPAGAAGQASLLMHFYGLTYNNTVELDHDINVIVNDQPVGQVQFDGATYFLSEIAIGDNILREGTNTIVLDNSEFGAAFIDHVYLDYAAVAYEAVPAALNDKLVIENSDGVVNVTGFTSQPLVVNATNPDQPFLIDSGFADGQVNVGVTNDMRVELIGENGYRNVKSIAPLRSTTLRDTANQADMLVITTRELAPGLDDLLAARRSQGLNPYVAFIDDLYDEFGYGDTDPAAIRNFVAYAAANWTAPAPRYLFIVGEATTDTLGYEANRPDNPIKQPNNIVPSEIIKVNFGGETVSDARLADADGDLKPDLAVGRWPVDSLKEVERLVKRTLAYENNETPNNNAVFTSDPSSPTEFVNFTNRLIEQTSYPVESALLFDSEENSDMLEAWSDAWLVTYVGHGSLELWGEDELLTKDQVSDIKLGDTPPIVLQFSCLTGQFAHPSKETISERMLKQDDGPIALVAATSLTLSGNQSPFAINLVNALKSSQYTRIGDALQAAKTTLDTSNNGLQEISDTFGLIGDPTALIQRPNAVLSTQ